MFEHLEIEWQDDPDNGKFELFDSLEIATYQKEVSATSFRLDIPIGFKKTTLNKLIDFILETIKSKTTNEYLIFVSDFVGYTIMACMAPKSLTLEFFNDNAFRKIESLFDSQYGDKYILKEKISNLTEPIPTLIEYFVRNKILREDKDRFWVHKVILKNIRVDFIDKKEVPQ